MFKQIIALDDHNILLRQILIKNYIKKLILIFLTFVFKLTSLMFSKFSWSLLSTLNFQDFNILNALSNENLASQNANVIFVISSIYILFIVNFF